ncbi:hypothetical protein GYA49_06225 [Candidatus Beckwithbacteria bacterium]|nr:hypothetical protein [Candidatus Beckwithbacteria bacterium]
MYSPIILAACLIPAALNLILGLLVIARNPNKRANQAFFFIAFWFVVWSICLFFYQYPLVFTSVFWIKATYFSASFISIGLLILSYVFPREISEKPHWLAIAYTILFLIFISFLLVNQLWIRDVVNDPSKGLQTIYNPLSYLSWLVAAWTFMFWAIYNWRSTYFKLTSLERLQLKYVFFGIFTWAFGATIIDVVLPFILQDTRTFPFSTAVGIGLSIATAYAILKHRLMDIRLVLARTVSYTLLTLLVVAFYTIGLFLIGNLLLPTHVDGNQLLISAFLALIIAYTIQPIRRFLEQITENIFFKENYDSDALLSKLSKTLSSTLNLTKLGERVFALLEENIHLEFYSLLLFKENGHLSLDRIIGHDFIAAKVQPGNQQLGLLLRSRKQICIYDELPESSLKQFMRTNNLGVLMYLRAKDSLVGALVLGNKKSGDVLTGNDIKVLQILAPQLAIAIQNARQFEEIQQFSEKLKVKIKEATTNLETANQKLKELDKRKDEFLSVAAHELRAPLTAVKGYLSMVLDGDGGSVNSKVKDFIQGAVEGAEREVRLVNNMLNVSRIEEGRLVYEMGKVRLRDVARSVFDEFNLDAETKDLRIKLQIPNGIKDSVWVDKDRIHEVVANFVSNAIKYTDKGDISIALLQPTKTTVRLEVADTGYGMSEGEQKKLFSKFFRAESSAGKAMGTGLGLYITKLLVEKFDGKIGFSSEMGKGSIFWFELPLTKKN